MSVTSFVKSLSCGQNPDFLHLINGDGDIGHGEIKSVGFNRGGGAIAGGLAGRSALFTGPGVVVFCSRQQRAAKGDVPGDVSASMTFVRIASTTTQGLEVPCTFAVAFWNNHAGPAHPAAHQDIAEDCRKVLARFQGFSWEATPEAVEAALQLKNGLVVRPNRSQQGRRKPR